MRERYNRYQQRKKSGDETEFGKAPSQEMLAKMPTLAHANIPGREE